jgi:hypothetical protein
VYKDMTCAVKGCSNFFGISWPLLVALGCKRSAGVFSGICEILVRLWVAPQLKHEIAARLSRLKVKVVRVPKHDG